MDFQTALRSVRSTLYPIAAALTLAGGCASDAPDERQLGDTDSDDDYEAFRAGVYRDPNGVYIVDGDTPIETEAELRDFYSQLHTGQALIVHQVGGVDATWSATQKLSLTYCVSTAFAGNYAAVVNAMNAAAGDWEASAYVDFIHVSGQDGACNNTNTNVLFDVSPTSGQPFLARAFFPNSGRAARNVLIDASSFGSIAPWTLTGILRHELGHTLGFRHEHTRPEAGRCFEDNNWRALTPYDAASVMHYPQCNGSQRGDLVLTGWDRAGAAGLYGAFFGGSTWERNATWCNHSGAQLFIADFNGDSRDDMLCHDNAGNKWIDFADGYGQFGGTDWFRPANWCSHANGRLLVGDFNGDHRADLMCHDVASGYKWIDFADGYGLFWGTDYYRNANWCSHSTGRLLTGAFSADAKADLMCHDVSSGYKWIAFSGL